MSNATALPIRLVARLPIRIAAGTALVATAMSPIAALVVCFALLLAAARVDLREHRLPDRLVGAAALPILGIAALAVTSQRGDIVAAIATGAALLAGLLLVLHLADPAGMGFGDVKAAAVLGAALGVVDPQLALWVLGIASAVGLVWIGATRRRVIAFGAPLVVAGIGCIAFALVRGAEVVTWR
ncbi:MAG TPA: prepilin peptidase [Ilumatobacteraceae bacterium]